MNTYQVEIKETLCMTVEVNAKNAQEAEAMVQKSYAKEEYTSFIQSILSGWNLQCWKRN